MYTFIPHQMIINQKLLLLFYTGLLYKLYAKIIPFTRIQL